MRAEGEALVWFIPEGAEVLDRDGRQIFYGTPTGAGSTIAVVADVVPDGES